MAAGWYHPRPGGAPCLRRPRRGRLCKLFAAGRDRPQRDPRRGDPAEHRGPHRADRGGAPHGRSLARAGLRRLRRHADPALPRLDPLPQHPVPAAQAPPAGARPLGDLPADRGHLHALHPDQPARDPGAGRSSAWSGAWPSSASPSRWRPSAGSGGCRWSSTSAWAGSCSWPWSRSGWRWTQDGVVLLVPGRRRLHLGNPLLRLAPPAVPPRGLARSSCSRAACCTSSLSCSTWSRYNPAPAFSV